VVSNEQKIKDFLEKRKAIEEKERERQLQMLKEHKEEINKKRERILSACGVRQPYMCKCGVTQVTPPEWR
jgi:hypothetical protein